MRKFCKTLATFILKKKLYSLIYYSKLPAKKNERKKMREQNKKGSRAKILTHKVSVAFEVLIQFINTS